MQSILLIDDEPIINALGARILENLGYKVTAVHRSPEALAIFSETPGAFDLVITDFMMPVMKGNELSLRLREIRSDIPVILCTGFDDIPDRILKSWRIDALLAKPYSVNEINRLVTRFLDTAPRFRRIKNPLPAPFADDISAPRPLNCLSSKRKNR